MGLKKVFYIIMTILVVITFVGLMGAYMANDDANKAVDAQLIEYDQSVDNLVNVCLEDLRSGLYAMDLCDKDLMEVLNGQCQQYSREQLPSCSKVEDYLNQRGLI